MVNGAWEAVYSSGGAYVYVTRTESDSITILNVDIETGKLNAFSNRSTSVPDDAPAGAFDDVTEISMSSDGRCMFVAAIGNSSLTSLSVDSVTGNLVYVDTVSDASLVGASDLLVSPDAGHVYMPSIECECIVTFAVDEATCAMTHVSSELAEATVGSLVSPRGTSVSPDGSFLYVTDSELGMLLRFSRDPVTGALTLLQTLTDGDDLFT